jgi:hypothetical protein
MLVILDNPLIIQKQVLVVLEVAVEVVMVQEQIEMERVVLVTLMAQMVEHLRVQVLVVVLEV